MRCISRRLRVHRILQIVDLRCILRLLCRVAPALAPLGRNNKLPLSFFPSLSFPFSHSSFPGPSFLSGSPSRNRTIESFLPAIDIPPPGNPHGPPLNQARDRGPPELFTLLCRPRSVSDSDLPNCAPSSHSRKLSSHVSPVPHCLAIDIFHPPNPLHEAMR